MTNLEQTFLESATRYFRESQSKEIDWEQRRYEIAKDVLNAILQLPSPTVAAHDANMTVMAYNVRLSVKYADALIKELKKK